MLKSERNKCADWKDKFECRRLSHPVRSPTLTAKRPTRREWTKDDVRELKALARQKTPVAKIAKSLKRTPGATQQKVFTVGVSLDSRQ